MRYLMFIKHTEDYRNKTVPPSLYEAMGEFVQEGFKSGKLIDTAGLKPTSDASKVRLSNRKITVTDGPFAESKEQLGGFWILECGGLDEAVEWAGKAPIRNGALEVRPIVESGEEARKLHEQQART